MREQHSRIIEAAAQARRENRTEDAYRLYLDAVELCRDAGDRRGLIAALMGVANVDNDRHDYESAIVSLEEATALAREQGDPLLLAHTVRHLGDVLRRLKRHDEAAKCYDEALALYRAHTDPPPLDLANAIRASAVLKDDVGASADALPLWEQAHQLYASLGIQAGVAESKARQARIARGEP